MSLHVVGDSAEHQFLLNRALKTGRAGILSAIALSTTTALATPRYDHPTMPDRVQFSLTYDPWAAIQTRLFIGSKETGSLMKSMGRHRGSHSYRLRCTPSAEAAPLNLPPAYFVRLWSAFSLIRLR